MEAASLALGAYKDAYFVVMGIYRLGMSAHYYKKEQEWTLTKFHGEYLYLRSYCSVFAALNKAEGNDQIANIFHHICSVVEHLLGELSSYRELLRKKDTTYNEQMKRFTGSQEINPQELKDITMERLLAPNPLEPEKPKKPKRRFGISLGSRLRKEPAFKVEAWEWALFNRQKLDAALEQFELHNSRLSKFEWVIGSSLGCNLKALAGALEDDPLTVQAPGPARPNKSNFVTQAKLIDIQQSSDCSQDPFVQIGLGSTMACIEDGETFVLPPQTEAHTATIQEVKRYASIGTLERDDNIAALNQLAGLLKEAGTHGLHTLPLRSVTNDDPQYIFEFSYPPGTSKKSPVTLRDLIVTHDPLSLLLRFHIALTISQAIGAFHAVGWLHKSIRSDSVCFFYDQNGNILYEHPYLIEFEYSRPDIARTNFASDENLARNLYRHPERQGLFPTAKFNKTHDLYSLGVVLLELGVWKTAESMREDFLEQRGLKDTGRVSSQIRDVYLRTANEELEDPMGPKFESAVKICLSGGLHQFLNQDTFAMHFWETVVKNVENASVNKIEPTKHDGL